MEHEWKLILMEESGILDSSSRMSPCRVNLQHDCILYIFDQACLVFYQLVNFDMIKNMKLFLCGS